VRIACARVDGEAVPFETPALACESPRVLVERAMPLFDRTTGLAEA